jgi:hypothetical protein
MLENTDGLMEHKYPAAILASSQRSTEFSRVRVSHRCRATSSPHARNASLEILMSWPEYVVVRNAGGRAEPAVRDIVILSTMTEITDVVIIHHVGMC